MTTRIIWRGLAVDVRHTPNWLNTHLDHIEIEAVPRTKLPITATGYRSHFIDPGDLAEYDGPADFVRFWLDEAAKDWDAQLKLF